MMRTPFKSIAAGLFAKAATVAGPLLAGRWQLNTPRRETLRSTPLITET
ncbi:hypothetical protein [Xanthobacter sp.]|nr:hypothetical protein [Xanthobacter sp.]